MGLIDKLYERKKLRARKQELKWEEKGIFNIASSEVVNLTHRKRFLGNFFYNEGNIENFHSNLFYVLKNEREKERIFRIYGEEGYDEVLDASTIQKSLLYRDGIILGYRKACKQEWERFEERLSEEISQISPEKLEEKIGWEKKNYKHNLRQNFLLLSFLSSMALFIYTQSNVNNVVKNERKEIKQFYQQNGVCPKDSTSQEFYHWQKLWKEKFEPKN